MLKQGQPLTANDYPTSDGRPMAETDVHRSIMFELIDVLQHRYRDDKDVYVSGNLLLFYEEGNKRRHVSPDVFVVAGVPKRERLNYLTWEEGKGPDVAMEITSKTTRAEDVKKKFALYQDRLGVQEYFLFDPFGDYLTPSLQGFRRHAGVFRPIRPLAGRMPSKFLGLHLERDGSRLRLWDPVTGRWEPTYAEERARAEAEQARAEAEQARANTEQTRADRAEAERDHLRRQLDALRRELGRS